MTAESSAIDPARVAVFASGGGSNFEALVDAGRAGRLPAEIVLCVSNRRDAGVLERAARLQIPSLVINPKDFRDEEEYSRRLAGHLEAHRVEYIALAGYLRKVPAELVLRFRHRMVNIHPALLPSFGGKGMYGRRVHEAVLAAGVRWTGATVHIVDDEYDTGPIVLQEPVPVYPSDSVERLAARVLKVEHELYPRALRLLVEKRLRLDGRVVHILPDETQDSTHS